MINQDPRQRGPGGPGGLGGRGRGGRGESSDDRSQPDGSYRLGQLAASTYSVRAEARGFTDARLEGVAVDRALDITLIPLGAIAGQVVSLETSQPVPAFRVRVREQDDTAGTDTAGTDTAGTAGTQPREATLANAGTPAGGGRGGRGFGGPGGRRGGDFERRGGRWRSFENGVFEIDDLEPGSYEIDVVADGFTGTSVSAEVLPGEVTDRLVIALEEGISIRGVVVDSRSSTPLAAASVYLLPLQTEKPDATEREERTTRRADVGRFDVRDRRGESERTAEQAMSEAIASLEKARSSKSAESTAEDGSFKLVEVPEGRYLLVADSEGHLPYSLEVDVADGRLLDYTLPLDPGEQLSGKVTLDRETVAALTVVIRSADGYTRRGQADGNGRYQIGGLLPGSHSFSVLEATRRLSDPSLVVEIRIGKRNEFDYRHEGE